MNIYELVDQAGKIALEFGINPYLFIAVIWVESKFDPSAVNPDTGCFGLAQLNPVFNDPELYSDPIANMRRGAELLAAYHDILGETGAMLAAYNWGIGNVMDLQEKEGDQWRKHLPPETRSFITNVRSKAVELFEMRLSFTTRLGGPSEE